MMKANFTKKVKHKWRYLLVPLLLFTLSFGKSYAAECGLTCGDVDMTITCEGELIVYLDVPYSYHVKFFATSASLTSLVEVDGFELGKPIFHAVNRFIPGSQWILQVENIYDPKCYQEIEGVLPTWDLDAGTGAGNYSFSGTVCTPSGPFRIPESSGPTMEVVEVVKPTCPQGTDGRVVVRLSGSIMPNKCKDSQFEVQLDALPTKMGAIGTDIVFDNVPSGTHTLSIIGTVYSCPCQFGTPDPQDVTVKEPSAGTTSMACHNEVNISTDENCRATINIMDVAVGANDPCMMASLMDDEMFIYDLYGNLVGSGSAMANNGDVTFDAHPYVHDKLKVEIRDGSTDNWCWGYVNIEDKLPPIITCNDPSLTEISCLEFHGHYADNLIIHDCDPDPKVTIIKEKIIADCEETGIDYIKKIEITYFAEDAWGNKSDVCTDVIKIKRFDADPSMKGIQLPGQLIMPPNFRKEDNPLHCDDIIPLDQNGNPAPISTTSGGTAFPVLRYTNSKGQVVNDGLRPINYETNIASYLADVDRMLTYCKIAVTYEDFVFQAGCVKKIQRTWFLREWSCEGELLLPLGMQEIHIVDDEGPQFHDPVEDQDVSVNSYSCTKYKEIKAPGLWDNCSKPEDLYYQVVIFDEYWNKIGPDIHTPDAFDFPLGKNYVVYTAFDKCHNFTRDTAVVNVLDKTPPVVVCKEFLVVGISVDGTVRVPASAVDNGSYDDCDEHIQTCVLRMDDLETFERLDTDGDGYILVDEFTAACGRDYSKYAYYHDKGKDSGYYLYIHDLCTPEVYFCCADDDPEVDNDEVQVIFRATDHSGNKNECMVVVEIQDKTVPSIICPPDVVVDCEIPLPDLSDLPDGFVTSDQDPLAGHFGSIVGEHLQQPFGFHRDHLVDDFGEDLRDGVYFDNCTDPTIWVKTEVYIDQCHTGHIVRTFYAEDGSGNRSKLCEQWIYIVQRHPLSEATIKWPADNHNFIGCLDPKDTKSIYAGEPEITKGGCVLIGVNWEDQVFTFNTTDPAADEACFKILRTWRVIDWCKSDHSGQPYIYEHVQIIKVKDIEGPSLVNPDDPDDESWGDLGICAGPSEPFTADDCDGGLVVLRNSATDECTDDDDLKWTVKVKLNKGSFDEYIDYPGNHVGDATSSTYEIREYYPIGTHEVTWTVTDLCGNSVSCTQEFTVEFNKKPTPFAIDLTTVLMNTTGTVDLWAVDLNNKSTHPCYSEDYLEYSIVRAGGGFEASTPSIRFTCADVGAQGVAIDFYVHVKHTDLFDYTTVNVRIQDNIGICGPQVGNSETAIISGNISTFRSDKVRDMAVDIETEFNGASTMLSETITNIEGDYTFPAMPMGGKYDIRPVSTRDYLNGVTTLDLVQIQQYILGLKQLDSPYDVIAADVNNDQNVSASDIVDLRRVILGYETEFTNNNSWRFVDKGYSFENISDPLNADFPEVYRIGELATDMHIDFVGIKVADVNGSVAVENVLAGGRSRTSVSTDEQYYTAGETVSVPVRMESSMDMIGFQFTVEYDASKLAFTGFESAGIELSAENLGTKRADEGVLTASWTDAFASTVENGQTLFVMNFIARSNGQLSESFDINSSVANAEVYDASYEVKDLSLTFDAFAITTDGFELKQNTPNPFADVTQIAFVLPEAGNATLTFFDVTGKMVKQLRGQYNKGLNTVTIGTDEISATGVVYYTLSTEKYTDTKRMVVLK